MIHRIVSNCFLALLVVSALSCSDSVSLSEISGIAAEGAPIAGQQITLRDSAGNVATGVTGADGSYTISVAGLVPPFLIRVETAAGGVLYSIGYEAGVVNVHPYTNLIVNIYYDTQGDDLAETFANFGAGSVAPLELEIDGIGEILKDALELSLVETVGGENVDGFDFMTTPFVANQNGFDAFLDNTALQGDGSVVVTDGTSTQTTVITIDANLRTITISTTTETPEGTTTWTGVIGVTDAEDGVALAAALAQVEALMSRFALAITGAGANLTAGDLGPFFDSGYLDRGEDFDFVTANLAAEFVGLSMEFLGVARVVSFDNAAGLLVITFGLSISDGEQTFVETPNENDGLVFRRQGDGLWRIYGDQRIAGVGVELRTEKFYGEVTQTQRSVSFYGEAPAGAIQSVSVTGDLGAGGQITNLLRVDDDNRDSFRMPEGNIEVQNFPPAGTVFQFKVTPATGPLVTYNQAVTTVSNSSFDILTYNGTARGTFVAASTPAGIRGTTLTVTWSLPAGVDIDEIVLRAFVWNAENQGESVGDDNTFDSTTTTGMIMIPGSVSGLDVTRVDLVVDVRGKGNERLSCVDLFGTVVQ